jgi:tRNA (uracil-5-)-methyltransferase TRM9
MTTTRDVFNRIAPSWYNYRHRTRFRYELEAMATRWQQGRLLNIGAAHGPDFIPFTGNFELTAIDNAETMNSLGLKYARKYKFDAGFVTADAASLPFADASFDWAIAVAVYHHIATPTQRHAAFSELHRVLRPNGEAFITVWNRTQPQFWFKGSDVDVPWRTKGENLPRYHHLYTYGELERAVKKAGFMIIRSFPEITYTFPLKYFSRNICLHIIKV